MSIGSLQSEADLERFIEERVAQRVTSLQGQSAAAQVSLGELEGRPEVARGTGSLTFSANNDSASVTVSHGLPGAPVAVVASAGLIGTAPNVNVGVSNIDADSFDVRGRHTDATNVTTVVPFFWVAVL